MAFALATILSGQGALAEGTTQVSAPNATKETHPITLMFSFSSVKNPLKSTTGRFDYEDVRKCTLGAQIAYADFKKNNGVPNTEASGVFWCFKHATDQAVAYGSVITSEKVMGQDVETTEKFPESNLSELIGYTLPNEGETFPAQDILDAQNIVPTTIEIELTPSQ